MEFKYLNIDPKTASKDEIKAEINRLDQLRGQKENEEQGIKIFIGLETIF